MKRNDESAAAPPPSQRPRLSLSPDEAHQDVAEILANVAQDEQPQHQQLPPSPVASNETSTAQDEKQETDEESKSDEDQAWLRAPDGGTKHTRVGAEYQCLDLPTPN
ncbi:hypothetical protein TrVE_jg225 [Triparma verrucosa]|uniref:Uncharacterized protein n=2 Tax=Triparma TaxID=722752 RepID=A0A9W7C7M2_9STRA|nr:hypothetical protein TrVE_jg225 [Triparma verrucosa]GMH99535.1 hypothetical protein TrST_g3282 [Triparma strigata]